MKSVISRILMFAAALALLTGCAGRIERGLKSRQVDVSAFAGERPASAGPSETPDAPASVTLPALGVAPPPVESPAPAVTQPAGAATRQLKPGDIIVVDSVVGQVSGRPIFADAFLDPISERLRSEAQRLNAREFVQMADQIIRARLTEVVLSELFLAEAEASLTAEQQQGLLAFIRNLQEKTIAAGRGSRIVTEQRLMEEMGMTIEQYTERERNLLLILHHINQKIQPRVIVAWRDVQREYERRKEQFNTPSSVTLHILRLSARDDAELIEQVKTRLAAGESFEIIVQSLNNRGLSRPDPFPLRSDDISDIEINPAFRPHLAGLQLGQTSPPIETEGRVTWLHVAAIERGQRRTLYDVQRQLSEELRLRRETEERERYIRTLFAKGVHDEMNEMSRRLLAVAIVRYGR